MKLFARFLLIVLAILAVVAYFNYPKLNIISGYASKNMASTVFLTDRSPESVTLNDNDVPLIKLADVETEADEKQATASVFGLMKRTSICREGLGCTLVNNTYDPNSIIPKPHRTVLVNDLPFPYGNQGTKDTIFDDVDYQRLDKAVADVFANPESQKTRTVLITYKNEIIAERYVKGFNQNTPVLGWSMT
ncbi:MAG: serine hydrolase, partial [Pricia sp.]